MQRPDPDKRRQILAVAAKLFATRPYHEVVLDDVAAAAKVGKGTLYVYFRSKESLYGALLDDGFGAMVGDLQQRLDASPGRALDDLGIVVRALLEHARRFPHLFHLMRAGQQLPCSDRLAQHRTELMALVERVVRRGVRAKELQDTDPRLTAAYVPSLVRAAVLYGPRDVDDGAVENHILNLLRGGIDRAVGGKTNKRRRAANARKRTR